MYRWSQLRRNRFSEHIYLFFRKKPFFNLSTTVRDTSKCVFNTFIGICPVLLVSTLGRSLNRQGYGVHCYTQNPDNHAWSKTRGNQNNEEQKQWNNSLWSLWIEQRRTSELETMDGAKEKYFNYNYKLEFWGMWWDEIFCINIGG